MYKDYNMTQHTLLMETSALIPANDISSLFTILRIVGSLS